MKMVVKSGACSKKNIVRYMNKEINKVFECNEVKRKSCCLSHKGHWFYAGLCFLTICVVMYLGMSNLSLESLYVWMFSILYATTLGCFVYMILRNKRWEGCMIFHLILYLISAIYIVTTDIDCWIVWQ